MDSDAKENQTNGNNSTNGEYFEFIKQSSTLKIDLLKTAIAAANDSLCEPMKLNSILKEEKKLIQTLKDLRNRETELFAENQNLCIENQRDSVTFQYLEMSQVTRSPEIVPIEMSPDMFAGRRSGRSSPPTSLTDRPPTPMKTREQIHRELDEAEKRRQAHITARLEAIKMRSSAKLANLERIQRESEEASLERKRKEYMSQQKLQMQMDQKQKEDNERISKRKQSATQLKAKYDEIEKRLKEKVGEPKPISEIHAKQKQRLQQMAEIRMQKVSEMSVRKNSMKENGEKFDTLARGETPHQVMATPIKSLIEAKERRDNPTKYMTPRHIEKSQPHNSEEELELHEKIVEELEKLKISAPSTKLRQDIEADILEESSEHLNALEYLKRKENIEGRDVKPIPKLEFKLEEDDALNKKRKSQKSDGSVKESPFKTAEIMKDRRAQMRINKSAETEHRIENESGPKKKYKAQSDNESDTPVESSS